MNPADAAPCPTHALTVGEISSDAIDMMPDIAPFLTESDSGEIPSRLFLPRGALAGFTPGDIVAVSLTTGRPRVHEIQRAELVPPRVELRTWMRRWVRDRQGLAGGLFGLVSHVRDLDPAFGCVPALPLSELLARYRISWADDRVAFEGTDVGEVLLREQAEFLVTAHGMAASEAEAVARIHHSVSGTHAGAPQEHAELVAEAAAAVRSVAAAQGLVARWLYENERSALVLAALGAAATRARGHAAAVLLWAHATVSAAAGDVREVADLAALALARAPNWEPAIELAAEVAADRGDYQGAGELLNRLPKRVRGGSEAYSVLAALSREIALHRSYVMQSSEAVYHKVERFVRSDPQARLALFSAVDAVSQTETPNEAGVEAEMISALLSDGFATSCIALEGGMLARFIDRRGHLLPDRELNVARALRDNLRECYRVTAIAGDGVVTLLSENRSALRECRLMHAFRGNLTVGDYVLGWIAIVDRQEPVALSIVQVPSAVTGQLDELASRSTAPADVLAAVRISTRHSSR